eukprot:COSAG04_NODE_298_length_17490_cov_10.214249_5_plen_54_part_00
MRDVLGLPPRSSSTVLSLCIDVVTHVSGGANAISKRKMAMINFLAGAMGCLPF